MILCWWRGTPTGCPDVATELKERHAVSVETIVADLAVRSEVIGIAERLTSTEQPIGMLINNAGFGIRDEAHRRRYDTRTKTASMS